VGVALGWATDGGAAADADVVGAGGSWARTEEATAHPSVGDALAGGVWAAAGPAKDSIAPTRVATTRNKQKRLIVGLSPLNPLS